MYIKLLIYNSGALLYIYIYIHIYYVCIYICVYIYTVYLYINTPRKLCIAEDGTKLFSCIFFNFRTFLLIYSTRSIHYIYENTNSTCFNIFIKFSIAFCQNWGSAMWYGHTTSFFLQFIICYSVIRKNILTWYTFLKRYGWYLTNHKWNR